MKCVKVTIEFTDGEIREYHLSETISRMIEKGNTLKMSIKSPAHSEIFTAGISEALTNG
jgi:hypothetical protein